ncbi:ABC transporter permease [Ekhidna sp.]|uniref:ABC transporter permease n=1 Tax=Ekhidna sp. TaxID=2608089 RepID=UPI003B5116A4
MKVNNTRPPKWIQRLVERYCEPYLFEGISGDLEELFFENVDQKGPVKAKFIYLLQTIGFFRMRFKKRSKRVSNMKAIWSNYLLTSFRSLKRHKSFFAINLAGLTVAITCSLYALVFVQDELNYDSHLSQKNQIYRLYKRHINIAENKDLLTYETSGMMGPIMTEEYPEIEAFSRVLPWWDPVVFTFDEKNVVSNSLYVVDSTFLSLFDVEMISGVKTSSLTAPSSVVLSESLAKSLFGNEDPLGKVVEGVSGDLKFTVTGVFKSSPRQSSLQFDALISWTTTVPNIGPMAQNWMNNWLAQGIYTFVKLSDGADSKIVEDKLLNMMELHFAERAENYFLKLQPIPNMYLYGDDIMNGRGMKTGSIKFIKLLAFSAILILIIASVNYVNIALSKASQTHTEVGIRKVMGSTRNQLMGRFVSETVFITLIASIISLVTVYIIIPEVNQLAGKDIPRLSVFQPTVIIGLLSFILFISLLVGSYPAFVLSSPSTASILKSSAGTVKGAGWFRKALLILQYSTSIFLIICTIAIIKQTNYLLNKPLGFDREQILVVDIYNEVGPKSDVFKSKLISHPNIVSVSTGRSAIGGGSYTTRVTPEGYDGELGTRMFGIDYDFFKTYGIETNIGRAFESGYGLDSSALMVNQAFIEYTGWKDPLNKKVTFSSGNSYSIIGVVNNFHINSLATSEIEPMILFINLTQNYASIKIGPGDFKETVSFVAEVYDELAEKTPFNYYFVDQWFEDLYEKEQRVLSITTIYAIISIILCALGLYGLTALLLQQRTKEISIRKVLGAPISSIVAMMNKQFMTIVLVSFLLAAPLAYYMIDNWLDQFVYKIALGALSFILAGVISMLISTLIISGLSIKTANTNPSQTLSNE